MSSNLASAAGLMCHVTIRIPEVRAVFHGNSLGRIFDIYEENTILLLLALEELVRAA
jgi:hypothetical protein